MNFWLIPLIMMLLASIVFVMISLYLLGLAIAAISHPDRKLIHGVFQGERIPHARFIILIPAHNEELLLGDILQDLQHQFYPADHYEIVVIADNCTDKTAEIATAAGAITLVRNDLTNRGKGQALNWAIQEQLSHWSRSWDALVIMDADSILNPDFLWFMDERLQQGYQAIQGYYGVLNSSDNWRTSLMSAALSVFHFIRPLGRDRLGLPCGLKGNGMCFSRPLIERFGYPASSVVEDIELALIYLKEGIGVKFSPGAQVYAQMATTQRHADTQRKRWEGGRFELMSKWAPSLYIDGVKEKHFAKVDAAWDLFVPPLTLLVLPTVMGWSVMLLILLLHPTVLGQIVFAIWSLTFCALFFYIATGLVLTRASLAVWLKLSAIPLFLFWKIASYIGMIFERGLKAPSEWIRTGREKM